LNVLFLSELFYPHGGGAELATYLYAKLLSEAGVNVVVVTNRFAGELETFKRKNLLIYRVPLFKRVGNTKYSILKKLDVLFSCFAKKLIRGADVVYVPRFWYSAIPLAKLHRKPVVVHLHDYIPICSLSSLYNASEGRTCSGRNGLCSIKCIYKLEKMYGRKFSETIYSVALNSTLAVLWKKCIKLCDAIVCVSKTHRGFIAKVDASLGSKIYTIYNPLPDISHINVEGDGFGYFGGPNFLKGFYVLHQAVKRINNNNACERSKIIDVHTTNSSMISDPFLGTLHNDGFKLYGRLEEKRFEELYRKISCVIIPSIWPETFSYTLVEALLRGRLVIASEIGAIPEISSGCDGALLFPNGNVEQLVDRLLYVRDLSKETIVDLGMRSREVIKEKFGNEEAISEFLRLLYNVSDDVR